MKYRMFALFSVFVAALGLVIAPSSYAQSGVAVNPTNTARVRVVHASPDAGPVDVYVNGSKKLGNASFFAVSDYLTVPAGSSLVQVVKTGQPVSTAVISANLSFAANTAFTLAAVGEASPGSLRPLAAQVVTDDLVAPSAGQAKVRVYHYSPDAPAVKIRANGVDLISSIDYPNASSPLPVPSGTYTIEVAAAAGGPAVLTLPNVEIKANMFYDFYAVGKLGNNSLRVESRMTPATGKLRIVHASPDTGPVDVYLDSAKVASNVPFFTASDYLEIPAGQHQVAITLAGQPVGAARLNIQVGVETARLYTVSAIGLSSGSPALEALLSVDDLSAPPPGTSRVRVYHFSPDAPPVGVRVKNGPTLIPSISYGNISPDAELLAGVYDLEVFPPSLPQVVVVTLNGVSLDSGRIYNIFAVDRLASVKLVSKIYGPNGTAPYQVALPIVTRPAASK